MSGRTTKFKVGLFVLIGVLVGGGAIIWLGAASYFTSASLYVTYFNESVQGLQVDSMVKYRGVDVGRVAAIRVAPDYRLIEVVMQIRFEGALHREVVAQIKSVGITGLVFVGLDRAAPGEEDETPRINFASEYPIIPSKPSDIGRLISGADQVITRLKAVDFDGLVKEINKALGAVEGFFNSPKIKGMLASLDQAALSLNRAAAGVEKALDPEKTARLVEGADKVLSEAGSTLEQARRTLKVIESEAASLRLGPLRQQVGVLVGTAGDDLRAAGENLKRATENLERLVQRLQADPSALLFRRAPGGRD